MQYKNEFGMSCTYRIETNYKKKLFYFIYSIFIDFFL